MTLRLSFIIRKKVSQSSKSKCIIEDSHKLRPKPPLKVAKKNTLFWGSYGGGGGARFGPQ